MNSVQISVRETAGVRARRPVTGGVPIAEAAAPAGSRFCLQNADGIPVPLQSSVLAQWKDGSARWVLLDFQSDPPSDGCAEYALSWGPDCPGPSPRTPVLTCDDTHELKTGDVCVMPEADSLARLSKGLCADLLLVDGDGQLCRAVVESAVVETAGPLRSTLALRGAFHRAAGERVFQFRLRISVYAGLRLLRLDPMILVDPERGIIRNIRELRLVFRPGTPIDRGRIGAAPVWAGSPTDGLRLLQTDDVHYRIEGAAGAGGKAPGWIACEYGDDCLAATLREFWQQWPKSLEITRGDLSLGLLPRFDAGEFEHMGPWYKHQYFFEGNCYRLRTGQARRWDAWIDLGGDGPTLNRIANAPLVPAVNPEYACAAGVWDAIAPAGVPSMKAYDPWAENLFEAYCRSIEVQRDYGAMNWGDWFGERQVNWGNHEYDTTNQILIQFARTGDSKYFRVADAAARHSSEVDTIHFVNPDLAQYFIDQFGSPGYPPRAGMVHEHAVGHVGSFYPVERVRELFVAHGVGSGTKQPYLCLDPYNLGHIWTQGLVRHYFLTGDPFIRETVQEIGDNLAQLVEDRQYKFIGHSHCGRTAGWSLLALAGAYELGFDPRYLKAMKTIVDDALAEQDPVCGGWLYSLPRGHCYCEKAKHVGMAGFITAILINGLSRYYFLSSDPRLPDAIERGVTFLDNDTWREEWKDWRYTSCPASHPTNRPGVVVMAHVNAIRIAGNAEQRRILEEAWRAKFKALIEAPEPGPGLGKTFTATMYGCAQAAALTGEES